MRGPARPLPPNHLPFATASYSSPLYPCVILHTVRVQPTNDTLLAAIAERKANLEEWCRTSYGEAVTALAHVNAVRLFVESILRCFPHTCPEAALAQLWLLFGARPLPASTSFTRKRTLQIYACILASWRSQRHQGLLLNLAARAPPCRYGLPPCFVAAVLKPTNKARSQLL